MHIIHDVSQNGTIVHSELLGLSQPKFEKEKGK